MVRPDLPPPANAIGSFEAYLAKARGVRRVGTLMGEKTRIKLMKSDLKPKGPEYTCLYDLPLGINYEHEHPRTV